MASYSTLQRLHGKLFNLTASSWQVIQANKVAAKTKVQRGELLYLDGMEKNANLETKLQNATD